MAVELDHLLVAAPDRDSGIEYVADLTGVTPTGGGQHPQFGTHNALAALGEGTYLEVIAPDPSQPDPGRPRLFGMDDLREPRLITWCARPLGEDIEAGRSRMLIEGIPLGTVLSGGRSNPDGSEVRWSVTDPYAFPAEGLIPFLIAWGDTPHPSGSATQGLRFQALRAEHPDGAHVAELLAAADIELACTAGPEVVLIATLETPKGMVELR